jgi:branched-chain amino acid aminotransferase
MKRFELADWPALVEALGRPYQKTYYAMYSSVYGGIVTDPRLMLIPIDDHMVHRGDGVFEALKAVDGHIYNLTAHLERLVNSARGIELNLPVSLAELEQAIIETARAAALPTCMIRIYVSRGPGGFGVNPYECPAPQLYVVITALGTPFMTLHPEGARLCTSAIPAKSAEMAKIKNCNYAPNVLMKKEAVDRKFDFSMGFDERGFLTEGATENMGIVSRDNRLLFPALDRILTGTTMLRAMALSQELVREGVLSFSGLADITHKDILEARELIIAGTTLNVVAGVEFDGHPIGTGKPGPVYHRLAVLLENDMRHNPAVLTPLKGPRLHD